MLFTLSARGKVIVLMSCQEIKFLSLWLVVWKYELANMHTGLPTIVYTGMRFRS